MAKTKKHPGSIKRNGHSWRVTLCVGGKVHRFTVKSDDKSVAIAKARQVHAELELAHKREQAGLPGVVRFSALLDEYTRTELPLLAAGARAAYSDSLKPIRRYFVEQLGDPAVTTIRAGHISAYLDWRRTARGQGKRKATTDLPPLAPLAPRTLNKDRRLLHRLFTIAAQREYREGNPVKLTEARKADEFQPVILDGEQYDRLLTKCTEHSPMLGLYVLLLGETGIRSKSEALHLRWDDVKLSDPRFDFGSIEIRSGRDGHRTKSGKSRVVPMTRRLSATVRQYFAECRLAATSPFIFAHTGAERRGERIASLTFAFKKAARAAKVPAGFRAHDLRHRRVTTWLAAGMPHREVQKAMGHSTITTTTGYDKFTPDRLRVLTDDTAALRQLAAGGAS